MRAGLQEEFGYTNPMQVPKLEKIVINMGVGEAAGDQKKLDAAVAELTLIAGQKPVKTLAKKAIAGFKIREGLPIGCKVTLRKGADVRVPRPAGDDRAAAGARLPRHPGDKGFDGRGNFAMGLKEQIIFPEIDYDKVDERARHGHHVRHHGQDRCRGEGAAARASTCRSPSLIRRSDRIDRWKTAGRAARQVPRSREAHGQDILGQPQQQARAHGRRATSPSAPR